MQGISRKLVTNFSNLTTNVHTCILYNHDVSGACIGLSDPLVMSLPGRYFDKKRATAYSIAFVGVDLCLLIVPFIFAISEERYGFRGAMIILAGIWLQGVLTPFVAWPIYDKDTTASDEVPANTNAATDSVIMNETQPLCPPDDASGSKEVPETPTEASFSAFCAHLCGMYKMLLTNGQLFAVYLIILSGIMGCLNVNFIVPSLGQELGMTHLQTATAFMLLSAVSLVSRVTAGFAVDRFNLAKLEFIIALYVFMVVFGLALTMFLSEAVLFCFMVIFGMFGQVGMWLCIPAMMDVVPLTHQGAVSWLLDLTLGISIAVGPVILGRWYME